MPLETLENLQDLEITGTAESPGSQQDDTQYQNVESGGQQSAQTFHPAALHPASQAHTFEQPHSSPFYPPLVNPFSLDNDNTLPIDPGLLDARFDHPTALGPAGDGVAGFHRAQWAAQPPAPANLDSFIESPTRLPQYNSSTPLVPGISSFEPMVSTTWSMDGSVPSTSTSGSRVPTMSSSLSARDTSTPASSHSPSSPRKAVTSMIETPAASTPNHPGMQLLPRVEDQPKKRRQGSGAKAQQKTNTEKRSYQNNLPAAFTTPQVPIAPAPISAASTSGENNNKKDSSSSFTHSQTTTTTDTMTTNNSPFGPSRLGPSMQPTTLPAQAPDPRARNREAANRCRAKSKVAVAELEATERAMSTEHQALTQTARSLRNEVLALKNELLMHGNCNDDLIQQYLANSARMVGSGVLGTTVAPATSTTTSGLPIQPPGPMPPGALLVVPPSAGGGPSQAMLTASPPRLLPGMPPLSSAPDAGTTAARVHQRGDGGIGGARTH